MSSMLTFEGADELKKILSEIDQRKDRIIEPAMDKATDIIHQEIKRLAPYDKRGHKSIYGEGHLRDEIPVIKLETGHGIFEREIGWSKGDNSPHFYAKFHEWGTSKMRARPFMSKGFRKKKKEAEEYLIETVARGIENEYK